MNKNFYIFLLALCSLFTWTCTNPLEDVDIKVSSNVFHYTGVVVIQDVTGAPISDTFTMKVSGPDAAAVYDLNGEKEFVIKDGIVGYGINPKNEPTNSRPLHFNITVTCASYLPVTIPVTIRKDEFNKINVVKVIKLGAVPNGVSVETPSFSLTGNATPNAVTIGTKAENGLNETTSIQLPKGTQFLDADGKLITGSRVNTKLMQMDVASDDLLSVFPGGSFFAPDVVGEDQKSGQGMFSPAAYVDINMSIDGAEVKRFNQPITVTMQISPAFYNSNTKATVKAGDPLNIYSYQVETSEWKFERSAPVTVLDGKLVVSFQTNHLTGYLAGLYTPIDPNCAFTTTFKASWIGNTAFPVNIRIYSTRDNGQIGQLVDQELVQVQNDSKLTWNKIPANYLWVFSDMEGHELGRTQIANTCSGNTDINLTQFNPQAPHVTMQLYVRCPNQTATVEVLPTFYMYYKETGTSQYQFLGVVNKGYISTLLLNTSKTYDFKAVWGDKVKVVGNKTVVADNSATVGTKDGDILGIDSRNNLNMLQQACKENGL